MLLYVLVTGWNILYVYIFHIRPFKQKQRWLIHNILQRMNDAGDSVNLNIH
jgi:hypothetical protein